MKHADNITIDDFSQLTSADHSVAIHTYYLRLVQLEKTLETLGPDEVRELLLDEVRRCQQLRKLHVLALAEQLELIPRKAAA